MLALFVLAVSWLAAAVGLVAKTPEGANAFTFVVMFVPYASSAFVPIRTMPGWIQGFARNQPVTPVIDTVRGLLSGTPVGSKPWVALAWCAVILIGSTAVSGTLFRRRAT